MSALSSSSVKRSTQPIVVHSQHRDPSGHVFESAIGLVPLECPTSQTRELGSVTPWVFGDQLADPSQFIFCEVATTITGTHEVSIKVADGDNRDVGGRVSSLRRAAFISHGI